MRHLNRLPIWRDANRLLVELEQSVRGFPRYHKYTVGSELPRTAMRLCQTIHRAQSRRGSRLKMVQQVSELVDDLKVQIQLARELRQRVLVLLMFGRSYLLCDEQGYLKGGLKRRVLRRLFLNESAASRIDNSLNTAISNKERRQ